MRIVFLIIFIVPNFCLGQSSVELNFNHPYIGRNLSLDFRYEFKSIYLNSGATYHINRIETLPVGIFFKNAGLASKPTQRLGIQFGGGYSFYENDFSNLAIYYKGYIASMNTYIKSFTVYEPIVANPQSDEDYALIKNDREFGPIFTFENTIGVSLNAQIFDNVQITLSGGFGHMIIRNLSNDVYFGPEGNLNKTFVFTSSYSLGLRYTLNSKEDSYSIK